MRRALFLHTPKTAGTSVQGMAREAYGSDQVISHGDFLQLGVEGCRRFDFVSGHFGYAFAKPLMEGRYSFTFLRDPVERLISLYEFCRTRDPSESPASAIAQSGDILHFLNDDHGLDHLTRIWNHQVSQLTHGWGMELVGQKRVDAQTVDPKKLVALAKRNLDSFDHVGFVATFDQDVAEIFADLGAPPTASHWSNATPAARRAADLPRQVLSRLEAFTQLDRELYDHAMRKYLVPARRRRWIKGATKWIFTRK